MAELLREPAAALPLEKTASRNMRCPQQAGTEARLSMPGQKLPQAEAAAVAWGNDRASPGETDAAIAAPKAPFVRPWQRGRAAKGSLHRMCNTAARYNQKTFSGGSSALTPWEACAMIMPTFPGKGAAP